MSKNVMRRLNFMDSDSVEHTLNISPEEVPTLLPSEKMSLWLEGDKDPYYKIQKISYPIKANGLIYEESFFESFLKKLSDHPYPGAKNGHSVFWGERSSTDFILVGGKLVKNGDGSGYVFFKNYIPPVGESGSNETFILENKSNMVHYSLVTYPREITEEDPEGNRITRVVESVFGERNDAVDYGTGAMKQVTNSAIIDDGDKIQEGEKLMKKGEVLEALKNFMANGELSFQEIAKHLNQEDKLINQDYEKAIVLKNSIEKAGIENPVETITALKNELNENAKLVRNSKIAEAFGPSKIENGNETNLVFKHAAEKLENVSSENLDKEINSLKDDPVMKTLRAMSADPSNDINTIGVNESRQNSEAVATTRRSVTL